MDFKLFFEPVQVELRPSAKAFQSFVYTHQDKMPDTQGMDLALIGLSERRGMNDEVSSPEPIREQLYRLKKGTGDYAIVDLGNLRNGPNVEDTYLRIKEVCTHLMEKNTIPILFGGSHDLDYGQFLAYEGLDKMISMINVDRAIDLNETFDEKEDHLSRIFKNDPNFLLNYHHLAFQSYFVHESELELLNSLCFDFTRLGEIRHDFKEVEPAIRDSDMLSFDLSSIQACYSPGSDESLFGLTGEEACQICWYAGQNEKLSSIGIFDYDHKSDEKNRRAFMAATMIWYFIEGFYSRKGGKNFRSNDYLIYEVHMDKHPAIIRFYKSKLTDRWWMEIPSEDGEGLFNRNRIVSCNYSDYEIAMSGELPERWLNTLKRL